MRDVIDGHLTALEISDHAREWLCDLWDVTQLFDDVADDDDVARDDLDKVIWATLVKMPTNPFYTRHAMWLVPAVSQMVLEWMASDLAEREGRASAQSYMWRAGYYRVVCLVASIEHGPSAQISEAALSLYGETLAEYEKEFS